jgi:hypothetical protein
LLALAAATPVIQPAPAPTPLDGPCDEWKARALRAEAHADQLEAALAEANERFRRSLALDRNSAIKTQRTTIKAVAWELQSAYDGGRADAEGWVKVWNPGLAENAGIDKSTLIRHRDAMVRDGLIEVRNDNEPVTKVDPDTGEVTTVVRPRVWLRRADRNIGALLAEGSTWTPSPEPKKPDKAAWGGARTADPATCPHEHTQTTCLDCGAEVRESQDATHDHTSGEENVPLTTVASTYQTQDATHDDYRARVAAMVRSPCQEPGCHALMFGRGLCKRHLADLRAKELSAERRVTA